MTMRQFIFLLTLGDIIVLCNSNALRSFGSKKLNSNENENSSLTLLMRYDDLKGKVCNASTSPIFEFGTEMQKIIEGVKSLDSQVRNVNYLK